MREDLASFEVLCLTSLYLKMLDSGMLGLSIS